MISLQTNNRILEATVMTVVKSDFEAWAVRRTDEDLLKFFSREIACGLSWVPDWQTAFQTVGCTKNVVQSRFLGL